MRLGRVVYEPPNGSTPIVPTVGTEHAHVFLEIGDHLGSTSVVLDKATGELVERTTYQAYGGGESSYRPERWRAFREDYGFTGKEEDIEVGLQYFGKRFYNPLLQRWVSPDPLELHVGGSGDLNLYAYVSGKALRAVDPVGLAEGEGASDCGGWCHYPDGTPVPQFDPDTGETKDSGLPSAQPGPARVRATAPLSEADIMNQLEQVQEEALQQYQSIEEAFPHGIPGHIELGDLTGYPKGLWNGGFEFVEWASFGNVDLSNLKVDIGPKEQSGAFVGSFHAPTPLVLLGPAAKGLKLAKPVLLGGDDGVRLGLGLSADAKVGREGYRAWSARHGLQTWDQVTPKMAGGTTARVEQAMKIADEIHFNTEGFRIPTPRKTRLEYGNPIGSMTDFEYGSVMSKYRDKTYFWRGDAPDFNANLQPYAF